MTEKKHLADNLIEFRKYKNMSQTVFAKQTKLSRGVVSFAENQSSNLRLGNLIKIASYMKISVLDIFTKDYVKNILSPRTNENCDKTKQALRICFRKACLIT